MMQENLEMKQKSYPQTNSFIETYEGFSQKLETCKGSTYTNK